MSDEFDGVSDHEFVYWYFRERADAGLPILGRAKLALKEGWSDG